MKTALVTTTIHVPRVLRLYREHGPDVMFFITGDRKSPESEIMEWLGRPVSDGSLENYHYLGATAQERLGYACSPLLGFNTIGRRSIAILEALKWGADIIVSVDDDNIPMGADYFAQFRRFLGKPYNGISAHGFSGWFDPGRLLEPPAIHRGFPFTMQSLWCAQAMTNATVGVAAGMCLGDPDISAVVRMPKELLVHGVHEVLREGGLCVETDTRTVWNSQNTAFIRELAPCFLMVPQWKRFDDIFSSLIAQRVMRERGMVVHFGRPFILQQRNPHDTMQDLHAEIWGMTHVIAFSSWLDSVKLSCSGSVLEHVRTVYSEIGALSWMPPGVSELGAAWCDDCQSAMGA